MAGSSPLPQAAESSVLGEEVQQLLGVLRQRLGRASVPVATAASITALESLLSHADAADDRFRRCGDRLGTKQGGWGRGGRRDKEDTKEKERARARAERAVREKREELRERTEREEKRRDDETDRQTDRLSEKGTRIEKIERLGTEQRGRGEGYEDRRREVGREGMS